MAYDKKDLIIGEKKFILRKIRLDEADKCFKLQSTLTDKEKRGFVIRTKAKYEALIKNGLMIGLFDGEELVGQIGTTLSTDRSEYIDCNNPVIGKLFKDSAVIEQGAYIIKDGYRGYGLQGQLEIELLKRLKKLIKNKELLAQKNEKLAELLKNNKTLILASGVSSTNPASTLTSLKNNSMIVNSVDNIYPNKGGQPVSVYTLMKIVSPKTKIFSSKKYETICETNGLLKEREEIVQKQTLQENNPLPKTWVEKVMKAGYVITKSDGKYNLNKPSGVILLK